MPLSPASIPQPCPTSTVPPSAPPALVLAVADVNRDRSPSPPIRGRLTLFIPTHLPSPIPIHQPNLRFRLLVCDSESPLYLKFVLTICYSDSPLNRNVDPLL